MEGSAAAYTPGVIGLLLVRHGEAEWNRAGRVGGQAPGNPLTARGLAQARAAASGLAGRGASWLLSSDLERAADTAATIGAALGLPVELDVALREQALGSLEGRRASELVAEDAPPGRAVTEVRWGGGESIADVLARQRVLLARLRAERDGTTGILVSHETALQVLLTALAGGGHADVAWTPIRHGEIVVATAG